mgnify:CR=1 FL=1
MKQRITVEQLQELTQEQQERIREWWKPAEGDWYYGRIAPWRNEYRELCNYDSGNLGPEPGTDDLPLLSIGQCIELLEDKEIDWLEEIAHGGYDGEIFRSYGGQLIDALWEAVKKAL